MDFYKILYAETEVWRPDLTYENFPRISVGEEECLQRPFEEHEILASIKICAINKAPSSDGY